MNQHLQTILNLIQQAEHLSDEEKAALSKAAKNADKELEITSFKLDRTEKVKHTTAVLLEETIGELEQKRKAVEAQNRELEIEAALERVRTIAMSMKAPADMPEVCKTIAHQLELLGVKEIRNVQTAIFYEEKGTYMNYEYYARHDKTIITETTYTNHKMHQAFAEQMLKGKGEFFSTLMSKAELPDWIAYQKTTNVFIDTYIETAPSLNYYWYSLGPVALGISTYIPLSEEAMNLFRRFLKVFELSYRRYLDIEKAEAQARESQIQLAMERVRARTMAMQRSDELSEAANLLFQQVQSLGIPVWTCGYNIWETGEKSCIGWMSTRGAIQPSFRIPLTENPSFIHMYESRLKGESFFAEEVSGEALADHYRYMFSPPDFKKIATEQLKDGFTLPASQVHNVFNFKHGNLIFISAEPVPEAWDIFKRFAKVFEQTYTRFLDLQKAEAQAREAQIEAALERVRSRTTAMQKSEELLDVIRLLSDQLAKLNFNIGSATFALNYKESNDFDLWMAVPGQLYPIEMHLRYIDHPMFNSFIKAKESGIDFFVQNFTFEEKNKWFDYFFEKNPTVSKEEKKFVYSLPGFASSHVLMKDIALSISNLGGIPYTDAENAVFRRFATVFEQAYTRFIDLQKAEAQARESQIQLALERVRARTMAMQKSEELSETAYILFQQFRQLGDIPIQVTIGIFNEEKNKIAFRITGWNGTGSQIDHAFNMDIDKSELLKQFHKSWKEQKASTVIELTGQDLIDWINYRNSIAENLYSTTDEVSPDDHRFVGASFFSKGLISFSKPEPIRNETVRILERFAGVFDQTYTRFLDLQKAEAQAREAQIEAALERVRSRSLAMHKSDELQEVVHTVFEKLKELNVDLYTAIIFIFPEGSKDIVWWLENKANQQYSRMLVPYADNPYLKDIFDAKESGKDFFSTTYSFEEKNELFHHLFEYTDFKYTPEAQKKFLLEREFATMSVGLAKNTGINITSYSRKSFSETENEILKRFAKVFDQAYTRFLDLQKAEALAREAKIEAALERVRSRTTGMQKSEELRDVIQLVFEQLRHLDFNIDSAHFNLNYKEGDDYNLWSAAAGQPYPVKTYIPYFDHPVFIKAREAKEKGLDFFTESYTQDEKNRFFEHLFKHVPVFSEERKKYILSGPGVAASTVLMNTISLWIMNYSGIPYSEAENAILKRFGKIFEQSHTRFLDLQKAEAQAREAIKRASVDRVRAEIASMRTTKDLERITPLIWNELTTLGVPFIRCGVFIMDEERQQIETHLSTPDGEAIATFNLPYNAPGETAQILAHWHKKELYKQYWNEAQFVEFTQNLVLQGAVTSGEKYFTENRPADLYLHFLPFLQGMLYAGNTKPLSDDALQPVQNLADAFSTAYARYEDFNKLEAAKEQIEKTLVDLKQAQQQLVQSEKMASLGELTAGIAHEIQNPLNFVNNFSELNSELIDELNDELNKGDIDEAKSIGNDIKQNLEKINHHGKRADAIVKGMLQHSRKSEGVKEPTDINALCDEYLRLSYHGMRAKDKSFNADFKTDFDKSIDKISIAPQDVGRVLLNLINNAFYAVNEKKKSASEDYKPTAIVTTKKGDNKISICVTDNGNGIPDAIKEKIFQPFFTTKPTGQGTGLGLSLAYDIIKAHGGEMKVKSKEGEGAEFIIVLPV